MTSETSWQPRAPRLAAAVVCALAALTLLWPLLTGQILFGGERSDMYIAGYSFRLFGAEIFKSTGAIPQWNPYLLGGLPYIAAMHGDIFYPTAWLRWIMPVDLAITWGMAIHFVLAGWFTFVFARGLGLSWSAAVTTGVAYELTGIVASQMSPGHDGKLFVSALAPLAFWLLLRAVRDGRQWAYGALSLVVALSVLGHYHMSYFLLIALGLWTLYLAFVDPARTSVQKPWICVVFAAVAVVLGVGISALQVLPFLEYIPYSPRAPGGADTGWAFATSYALPPDELFTLVLPQFNGMLDHYWGPNPLKFHTEYVGVVVLSLAILAWGDRARRRLTVALSVGVVVFLLFAFGGYSPLYRALFNVLPYLNKVRAMGMVFVLPALFLCLLAGIGLDRVVRRDVSTRTLLIVMGGFGVFALLGALGGLQAVADVLAGPERVEFARMNAGELRVGALRLLAIVVLAGGAFVLLATKRLSAKLGAAAVLVILVLDLWSIDHQFYVFSPRASVLFRDDGVTSYLKRVPPPYRAFDAGTSYGRTSILMAYGIPSVLGYHGFELRNYQTLGGRDSGWRNMFNPNVMNLLSVRFIMLQQPQSVPGFHQVVPPTTTAAGAPVVLYERDSTPAYARVVLTAAKAPDDQAVAALLNPRLPIDRVALFPDTSSVVADSIRQPLPQSSVRASVSRWAPGAMTIALAGADDRSGHLVVSENWYPDWHATVDGKPAVVRRADETLLSVDVPAGAKQVELKFDSPTYARGKLISAAALVMSLALFGVGVLSSASSREPPRRSATAAPSR